METAGAELRNAAPGSPAGDRSQRLQCQVEGRNQHTSPHPRGEVPRGKHSRLGPQPARNPRMRTPREDDRSAGDLQSLRFEGDPMNRMLIAVAGLVGFLSGVQSTWAFTTHPVHPVTMSNRLADPDELADRIPNSQSGGTAFGVPGGHMILQFSAPPSGDGAAADLSQVRVPYSCRANIGNS